LGSRGRKRNHPFRERNTSEGAIKKGGGRKKGITAGWVHSGRLEEMIRSGIKKGQGSRIPCGRNQKNQKRRKKGKKQDGS